MKRFKSNCGSYRLLGYGLNFMELWNCPDEELWYFPIGLFYAENPVQERGDIDTLGRLRVEDKNGYMIQINRIKVDDPVQAVEVLIEELMPWWLLEGFNGLSRDHIDSFSDGRRFFRSVKP
jgi:hypothetical protein